MQNTPLRILALNWRCMAHPQAGGSEVNLFEQAERWADTGHAVTVMTADPGREYAPIRDERRNGVDIIRRGNRFTVYLYVALFLLRWSQSFDRIVDVANGIPFFSPLFGQAPGVLVVHHVHGRQWFSEFPYPFAMIGWYIERRIVPLVYRSWTVIAVSPTTRDALYELGFLPQQVQIVYNGVVHPKVAVAPSRDAHRVAYIGRLKRYKQVDKLVRAIAALRGQIPAVHLDIVGDGDTREDLVQLIDELQLGEHVTIHGFVDEETKRDLLLRTAVFATPSMHEGWGLSVIEANAHGCPAVAYDVPGLQVAIRHGETGLLADNDDDFVDALRALLVNTDLHASLATGAQRWSNEFSWERCASSTLQVLYSCRPTRPTYLPQ